MKKILQLFLTFSLIIVLLAGCQQATSDAGWLTSSVPLAQNTSTSEDSPFSQGSQSVSSSQQQADTLPVIGNLDLRSQIDLMVYLEQVLEAISQKDMEADLQDFQIYTIDRNFKKGSIVCTIDYTTGILLHIIIDETTGDYFYVFAEKPYDILDFDDKNIQFSNLSGALFMNYHNFPYRMTYNWADNSWKKTHLPINDAYYCYILDGSRRTFGLLESIEFEQEKAKLVFSFEELMQQEPGIGSTLPITHYSFDPISQKATLSFSGIELSGNELASQLQQIKGITGVEIKDIDAFSLYSKEAGITNAIEITFTVSDKYNLYAVRENTDWDSLENGERYFWLWTEIKV